MNDQTSKKSAPPSPTSSTEKESFGEYLRREREMRGIPLDEIAEATRIGRSVLQALENDDFKRLPPLVYVRGFLRTYASYLGLDVNDVLLRYQSYLSELENSKGEGEGEIGGAKSVFSARPIPLALYIAAIIIVVAVTLYLLREKGTFSNSHGDVTRVISPLDVPTPKTKEEAVDSRLMPETVQTGIPESPEVAGGPPAVPEQENLVLQATCKELTWLRIGVDGELPVEYLLKPGESLKWKGRSFQLRIGNAAGIDLALNEKPVGSVGRPGEVIDITLP